MLLGGFILYRRAISMLIIVCLILEGCGLSSPVKSFEEASKRLLKLKTYTCDVTMRVTNNISTMEYRLKHFYKSPDKYRIEVVTPEELQGQVTIYNGSSSYIYHPGIDQFFLTENFSDSVECNAFIGTFIECIRDNDKLRIANESEGEKDFFVLEFEVPGSNSYMHLEKLWIDMEEIAPVKAEIYGKDGRRNVALYYYNFVYNPVLEDGAFEIKQ